MRQERELIAEPKTGHFLPIINKSNMFGEGVTNNCVAGVQMRAARYGKFMCTTGRNSEETPFALVIKIRQNRLKPVLI